VPSLLSGFLHIFLPESPKFLMSQGNYKKALDSFQRIYKLNKRKSKESYPVGVLLRKQNINKAHIVNLLFLPGKTPNRFNA